MMTDQSLCVLLNASSLSSLLPQLVLMGSILLVFYFFMIRPQQKRQQEQQNFVDQLKKGTPVVTIGGIHGHVYKVAADTITIEIDAKGSKMTLTKQAISLDGTKRQQKDKK